MILRGALTSMVAGLFLCATLAHAATNNADFWEVPEPSENLSDALGYFSSTPPTAKFDSTDVDYPVGAPVTMPDIASLAISLGAGASNQSGDGVNTLAESVFRFSGFMNVKKSKTPISGDANIDANARSQISSNELDDPASQNKRSFEQSNGAVTSGTDRIPFVQPYFDALGTTGLDPLTESESLTNVDTGNAPTLVPLPASGFGFLLMLSALAGMAAFRNKRKND
ncbi:MAG: VPLPA-CTERM sorting domain-containing protein [Paracoccaceae bacterium]